MRLSPLATRIAKGRRLCLTASGVIALGSSLAIPGCFGGQTGAEMTPTQGTGGSTVTPTKNGTVGQDGGNVDVSTPTTGTGSADGVCPGGTTDAPDSGAATGVTSSSVIEFVQSIGPWLVQYGDGTETQVAVSIASQSGGCAATASNGPATLSVPVTIRLMAGDGHFDLGLSGVVTASADASGGVGELVIVASRACGMVPGWLDPLSCAIAGVDLSGFDRTTIELSARAQRFGQTTQLLGSMRISGVPLGQCSDVNCSAKDWAVVASFLVSNPGDG